MPSLRGFKTHGLTPLPLVSLCRGLAALLALQGAGAVAGRPGAPQTSQHILPLCPQTSVYHRLDLEPARPCLLAARNTYWTALSLPPAARGSRRLTRAPRRPRGDCGLPGRVPVVTPARVCPIHSLRRPWISDREPRPNSVRRVVPGLAPGSSGLRQGVGPHPPPARTRQQGRPRARAGKGVSPPHSPQALFLEAGGWGFLPL